MQYSIVLLSGKGGTGKTTVSSVLSEIMQNDVIIDCDVDAANLHLLIDHNIKKETPFYGSKKAVINKNLCVECGLCETKCRFDAIKNSSVDTLSCEGCGFCYQLCPTGAIKFEPFITGRSFESDTIDSTLFYHAKLQPGEGNSGKLVSDLKNTAFKAGAETKTLIDGPPGIGCSVNASLNNTNFVLIVTEPTVTGKHDMIRLVKLLRNFRIKFGILINKSDLNNEITKDICDYSNSENIPIIGKLKFEKKYMEALKLNKSILDNDTETTELFNSFIHKINCFAKKNSR